MLSRFIRSTILIVATIISGEALAQGEVARGKVNYVSTLGEHSQSPYHARFRFSLVDSTCGGDKTKKTRWFSLRSGRMDGQFVHNMANLRNAYSTVMSGVPGEMVSAWIPSFAGER